MASSPLEASNASSFGQEVPGHAAAAPTSAERELRVWDAGLPPFVPSGSGLNFEATMLYTSWEQVPLFPPREMKVRTVFLEIFAGKAWLTRAMQKKGWLVLPPIDIVVDGEVRFPTDILDPLVMEKLRKLVQLRSVGSCAFWDPLHYVLQSSQIWRQWTRSHSFKRVPFRHSWHFRS